MRKLSRDIAATGQTRFTCQPYPTNKQPLQGCFLFEQTYHSPPHIFFILSFLLLTSFLTPYYSPPYFLLPLSLLLTISLLTPYYPLLPTYYSSPYSLLLLSLLLTTPLLTT